MPEEEDVEGFVIYEDYLCAKRKPFIQKYIDQYLDCIEKWYFH